MATPQRDSHAASDAVLARAYLDGDDDALRTLIDRYADALLRFCMRYTRNQEDSEDIVQECFIRLHANLHRLDLKKPLKPWLYRVCANLCHNLARDKRSINFSQLESTEGDDALPAFVDQLEDTADTPDIGLDRTLDAQRVQHVLERLPPKYRNILSLYYTDDLSYEEIASVLSLPLNTVRTHLKRAKDHLGRALTSPPSPDA